MEDKVLDIITIWAPAVLIVLSAINSVTKHYTRFNGGLAIIMEIIERLSFLASKRTGQTWKAPFLNVPPDPTMERMADVEERLRRMAEIKKRSRR